VTEVSRPWASEHPALPGAGEAGVVLEEGHRCFHGGVVAEPDRPSQRRAPEPMEHRHRLGGRERQGEAGHRALAQGPAQHLAGRGMATLAEQTAELVGGHPTLEPGGGRTPAEPSAVLLAGTGPVVLTGGLTGVVGPRGGAELGQAEHQSAPPGAAVSVVDRSTTSVSASGGRNATSRRVFRFRRAYGGQDGSSS
jgi:hypothetical protein